MELILCILNGTACDKLPFVGTRCLCRLSSAALINSKLFGCIFAAGNGFFLVGTGGGGVFGCASGNFGDPFADDGFGIDRTTANKIQKIIFFYSIEWNLWK